jgi:hypothetical protein
MRHAVVQPHFLTFDADAGGNHLAVEFGEPLYHLRRENILVAQAVHVAAGTAEQLSKAMVDQQVAAIEILDINDGGGAVDDGLEQYAAFMQGFLRFAQLGAAFLAALFQLLPQAAQCQLRFEPRQYFGRGDGMGHEIDGTGGEGLPPVPGAVVRADENDGDGAQAWMRLDVTAQGVAVDAGLVCVEQHDIGQVQRHELQRGRAARGEQDGVVLRGQQLRQRTLVRRCVVHNEHSCARPRCEGSIHKHVPFLPDGLILAVAYCLERQMESAMECGR